MYRYEFNKPGVPWEWSQNFKDEHSAQKSKRDMLARGYQCGPVERVKLNISIDIRGEQCQVSFIGTNPAILNRA